MWYLPFSKKYCYLSAWVSNSPVIWSTRYHRTDFFFRLIDLHIFRKSLFFVMPQTYPSWKSGQHVRVSFYWSLYERRCQWRTDPALSSHLWSRHNLSVWRPSDCSPHKCPNAVTLTVHFYTLLSSLCAFMSTILYEQVNESKNLKIRSCSSLLLTGLLPQ